MSEKQTSVHVRIDSSPSTGQLSCDECGHTSLRVADIIDVHGAERGSVLLCTECRGRHRHDGHR